MYKRQTYSVIAGILTFTVTVAVLATVFIVSKNLGNGNVSGKYFWFYGSMALLSATVIPLAIIKRKERISFKLPDLLMLLFCLATVLITLNHSGRLTNKCLLLIFVTTFYFYLRTFLSGKSRAIYNLYGLAFIITGLVEAVWGLMQLYDFMPSQHNMFKVTGSFFNPGPYSGWLAMVFPAALGFSLKGILNRKGNEAIQSSPFIVPRSYLIIHISSLITVFCTLLILPAAMSRASWLAALGGSAFIGTVSGLQNKKMIDYFRKYRKRALIILITGFILTVILSAGLFLLKKDSASGRALTWKIAMQTAVRHPFGVGLGNFGGVYGDVQATYFASGAGSEREEYVAGGVEYAFNEYLQICVETGIIPFLIFLAFVICVLRLGIKNKNYLPAGSLISLLIFASMSYPFNLLPFVIAFVFVSALCMVDNVQICKCANVQIWASSFAHLHISSFAHLFLFVTIALSMYRIYPMYEAYKQWNTTKLLYNMDLHKEAVVEYAKQYPYLQDEVHFLFEYAQSLSKSRQYEKSNEILRQAMQISCDPMLYNIMGKNYQALKEYSLAEQNLKKAINLVPNRLYPHYLLAKLYYEMGQNDKAEAEINIVMTKPPKVESMAVEEMREELRKLRVKN
jgi:O-antigen ligase